MTTQSFWQVVGNYNEATIVYQIILMFSIGVSIILANKEVGVALPKFALGITNLFIAIVFFGVFGTQPIQKYYAMPLFTFVGLLFICDAIKNKNDKFEGFSGARLILLVLGLMYPLISLTLGNRLPKMTLYIMPCPVICFSILVCACYNKKNKILLALLTIWGLTGVKAFFFNALEDTILLICGLYCLVLLIRTFSKKAIKQKL